MRLSGDLLMRAGTDRSDGVYPVLLSGSGGLGGSFTQVSNVDILEYDTTFGDVGHSLVSTTSRSCLDGVCRVVFFDIVSRVRLLCQPSKREVLVGTGSAPNDVTSTNAFSFPASRWLRDGALALSLQGWPGGHLAVRKGLDRRRATRHDPGFYCHRRKGPCVAHEAGCGVAHFTVLPNLTPPTLLLLLLARRRQSTLAVVVSGDDGFSVQLSTDFGSTWTVLPLPFASGSPSGFDVQAAFLGDGVFALTRYGAASNATGCAHLCSYGCRWRFFFFFFFFFGCGSRCVGITVFHTTPTPLFFRTTALVSQVCLHGDERL